MLACTHAGDHHGTRVVGLTITLIRSTSLAQPVLSLGQPSNLVIWANTAVGYEVYRQLFLLFQIPSYTPFVVDVLIIDNDVSGLFA